MSDKPKESRFFVLFLGALIGFIGGFILLLSQLPVDSGIGGFNSTNVEPVALGDMDFDYYTVLPGQTTERRQVAAPAPPPRPVQQAALDTQQRLTRVTVPAITNVQKSRPVPVAKSAGKQSYFLQAGTFPRSDDAERARVELLRLGLEAIIVIRQDNFGNVNHRVRVGPFVDQTGLDSARTRLKNGGIPFEVVRVTG